MGETSDIIYYDLIRSRSEKETMYSVAFAGVAIKVDISAELSWQGNNVIRSPIFHAKFLTTELRIYVLSIRLFVSSPKLFSIYPQY